MRRSVVLIMTSLALAGCTTASSNSSKKFSGAEADVAKVVDDMQTAGRRHDGTKACTELLARSLVQQLSSGGTSCKDEMTKAMEDADDYSIDVRGVTVSGDTATAKVQRGSDGPTATWKLVREANRWKLSDLG